MMAMGLRLYKLFQILCVEESTKCPEVISEVDIC